MGGGSALAWAEECRFHLYIFKPHYLENLFNCSKNSLTYFYTDIIEILLLNLSHIDMYFEVSCTVDHSYCDRKCGIAECDNIVGETFW